MYYSRFNTRFCDIILVGDERGLAYLHMDTGEGSREFEVNEAWLHNPGFFSSVEAQVAEYLDGRRKVFDVQLNPRGTAFQKKVWKQLCSIPYGRLSSYGAVAKALGNSRAARAVGAANGKNPIPLIIPCHRVVGARGNLTGFAHGLNIKKQLIALEKGVG